MSARAASIASASLKRTRATRVPKSILKKKPSPLPIVPLSPLSPNTLEVLVTSRRLSSSLATSPHVHFPPTPNLATVHSPIRSPLGLQPLSISIISPNASPASPYALPDVELTPKPMNPNNNFTISSGVHTYPTTDLRSALSRYPRSPYPSAPTSPASGTFAESAPPLPRRRHTTSMSLAEKKRRSKATEADPQPKTSFVPFPTSQWPSAKRMPSGGIMRPPPLQLTRDEVGLARAETAEIEEVRTARAGDQDSEGTRLNQAFWQSVTVHPPSEESAGPLHTVSLATPTPLSAVPPVLFAATTLWSPGLGPRRTRVPNATIDSDAEALLRAMLSPTVGRSDMGSVKSMQALLSPSVPRSPMHHRMKRSIVTAPSPNDPFAAFPSFSVVIQANENGEKVSYPTPVLGVRYYPDTLRHYRTFEQLGAE
ncbi:hypothetical protein FISHEDRAFT_57754 [Fistulina hepatica ATCC 64428]|uniref:Uncharacterized protein n=1 Tax=Fistulina hepatica ATCC 64428 TaxID=1128425 RepID=A0A0D7AF64_9AGAR|nr:hypothetical protein FISHEDRAFT_57754 [Fistulina hepatica ATCC 64428]